MSWADIVRNSNKTQSTPIQYVTSAIKIAQNNVEDSSNDNVKLPDNMSRGDAFQNIWCWGDYELLNLLIHTLTVDEIDELLNNITYKIQDIDSWSDPETHEDRKYDIYKCEKMLIEKKQLLLKK